MLNEVLNGKRAMNAHLAMLIAAALGLDAEPLLNLQTRYDMISAKRTPSFMQRIQAIRKIAAAL